MPRCTEALHDAIGHDVACPPSQGKSSLSAATVFRRWALQRGMGSAHVACAHLVTNAPNKQLRNTPKEFFQEHKASADCTRGMTTPDAMHSTSIALQALQRPPLSCTACAHALHECAVNERQVRASAWPGRRQAGRASRARCAACVHSHIRAGCVQAPGLGVR